jgi:transposase-like protein
MIYAATREEIEIRRKAFIRKWRLKHRAVADSPEEAGERLFAFTRLPPGQWRSVRTTNAIERLHAEFRSWFGSEGHADVRALGHQGCGSNLARKECLFFGLECPA